MFATRVRVSPWSARSSPRSVGRVTVTTPSSCEIAIRVGTRCDSVPSGPLTVTFPPADTSTVTPSGISIGVLPILLMCLLGSSVARSRSECARLPHEREHLAAHAALRGLARGDHPGRGGQDRGAEPTEDAREAVLLRVDA